MHVFLLLATFMGAESSLDAGQHERGLTVDEIERSYLVHVPDKARPADGWPVVLAFHGGGSNASAMVQFSGLSEKADEAGFVVVYPNGTGRIDAARTFNGGNCCGYAQRRDVDDVKFASAVLDDLATVLQYDRRRVFATGMSNGAIMSYRLASEMAGRIAAVAPVAGPMGTEKCNPSRPVPVCHFHGTNDQFAPFKGGRGGRSLTRTNFYSVEHSTRAWVVANGCSQEGVASELPAQEDDGTSVRKTVYGGGKQNSQVVLYTIENGGHTWPGRQSRWRILGVSTNNLSANDVMWEFFQRHPLPE